MTSARKVPGLALPMLALVAACELVAPLSPLPSPDAGSGDGGGGGRFVVVGNAFTNGWSDDGVKWNIVDGPEPNQDAVAVAYGDGVFVSVGIDVRTSRDGATWTKAVYDNQTPMLNVVYADGFFIVSGAYGRRMRSGDGGVTWTDYTALSPGWMWGLAVGNGIAVAVTSSFQGVDGTGGWSRSTDLGQTWTPTAAAPGPIDRVAFGNGVFVAAGANHVATSSNGTDWTDATVDEPSALTNVLFLDGEFYVFGSSDYWHSANGAELKKENVGLPDVVVHAGGVYVGAQYLTIHESTQLDGLRNVVFTSMDMLRGLAYGPVVR